MMPVQKFIRFTKKYRRVWHWMDEQQSTPYSLYLLIRMYQSRWGDTDVPEALSRQLSGDFLSVKPGNRISRAKLQRLDKRANAYHSVKPALDSNISSQPKHVSPKPVHQRTSSVPVRKNLHSSGHSDKMSIEDLKKAFDFH